MAETEERGLHVPWTIRDLLYAFLATIALLIATGVLLVLLYFAWRAIGLPTPEMSTLVQVAFALEAVLLVPPWLFGPRKYGGGWRILGLRGLSWGKGLVAVVVGFGLILLINVVWSPIMEQVGLQGQPEVLPLFGGGIGGLLIALFLGGVVAPLAEEVLFRGFVYTGLRSAWGVGWALVISSLIFAVIHGFAGVIPPIFVMAIILALTYEYTGSLWPAVAVHAAVNSFSFIASYLAQYYPQILGT